MWRVKVHRLWPFIHPVVVHIRSLCALDLQVQLVADTASEQRKQIKADLQFQAEMRERENRTALTSKTDVSSMPCLSGCSRPSSICVPAISATGPLPHSLVLLQRRSRLLLAVLFRCLEYLLAVCLDSPDWHAANCPASAYTLTSYCPQVLSTEVAELRATLHGVEKSVIERTGNAVTRIMQVPLPLIPLCKHCRCDIASTALASTQGRSNSIWGTVVHVAEGLCASHGESTLF